MLERLVVERGVLHAEGEQYPCALGKGGILPPGRKREGDGATPAGSYRLRECWVRADRVRPLPETALPLRLITARDGWCDDPAHPLYNRHFVIPADPAPASFEQLWREDEAYDLIVPLGYNDAPIIPGKGSAIFLHVAKQGYPPTEGCVALAKEDLLRLLPVLSPHTVLDIQ